MRARKLGGTECPDGVVDWLEAFAANVRNREFEAAQTLFSEDAFGFGTRATVYRNRADLRENQWQEIWPKTTGFYFDLSALRCVGDAAGSFCCASCQWQSQGIRAGGATFPRAGRCTILLERPAGESKWIGVHTHFSIDPDNAAIGGQ